MHHTGIGDETATPLLAGPPPTAGTASGRGREPGSSPGRALTRDGRARAGLHDSHSPSWHDRVRRASMPVSMPEQADRLGGHGRSRRESVNLNVHHLDNYRALARKDSCVCGGVADDVQRRREHCRSDWAQPFASWQDARVNLAGGVFYFVALWFCVVSLAEVAREDTESSVGVKEFLLLTSFAGVLQSLVGVQPLLVLRPTGPVVLIMVQLFELSKILWPVDSSVGQDPATFQRLTTERFLLFTGRFYHA